MAKIAISHLYRRKIANKDTSDVIQYLHQKAF
jgi:hypothetical protein